MKMNFVRKWCNIDLKRILLLFEDDTTVIVKKVDFDRAFLTIITNDKEIIERDYAM